MLQEETLDSLLLRLQPIVEGGKCVMTFKPIRSVLRPETSQTTDLEERPVTMRVEYVPTANAAEAGANAEKRKPMGETKLAEFSELLRYVLMKHEKANECKERQQHIKAFIAKYQVCAPARLLFLHELFYTGGGRMENEKCTQFLVHFYFTANRHSIGCRPCILKMIYYNLTQACLVQLLSSDIYCNPGNFSKLINLVNWQFWRFMSY